MKKLIIFIVIIAILVGGWFGYQELKRNRYLQSGKNLLITNVDEGLFAYSSDMKLDNIDRSWKIIGYLDELSERKISAATEGLSLHTEVRLDQTDVSVTIAVPADDEIEAWQEFISLLTEEQKKRCDEIDQDEYSQYCYVRHGVFQALNNSSRKEICDGIFIPHYRSECIKDLDTGDRTNFVDENEDNIIDIFGPIPDSVIEG